MLATQEGGMNGVEFSALSDLLLAHTSPPPAAAGFSAAFTPALGDVASDETMSDEHISPSQQITMLLEQEGIKASDEDQVGASPFDFSGAMPPSGGLMPPPPAPKSPAKKRSRAAPKDGGSSGGGNSKVNRKKGAADAAAAAAAASGAAMPAVPARLSGEFGEIGGERRLSDGAILELFDSLEPEQQRRMSEAAATQGLFEVENPSTAAGAKADTASALAARRSSIGSAATPSMGVDVSLAEAQSGASKQSGEGTSPFNQLSPLHLSDFLQAF